MVWHVGDHPRQNLHHVVGRYLLSGPLTRRFLSSRWLEMVISEANMHLYQMV